MRAEFVDRESCITCGGNKLRTLSKGGFSENPLHGYLQNDPWGLSPLPFIEEECWIFVECSDCSQKFHKRILSNDWLKTYYSEWISSDSIDQFYSDNGSLDKFNRTRRNVEHVLLLEKSTRELRGNRQVRILDFGCGDGDFLKCCEMFGFESVGVEFSDSRQQRSTIDFYPSLDDVNADKRCDFQFDAITMFEVLEHLPCPLETLKTLVSHLKKGGVFILETPNCNNVKTIKTIEDYRLIHPLGHINAFAPDTMIKIAQAAGLEYYLPGTPQVCADYQRIVKREVRRLMARFKLSRTQMYFRKV